MEQGSAFLIIPVVLITLWHAFLISKPLPDKPITVSEHVLFTPEGLAIHRLLHCFTSASFFIYAYLNADLYGWTIYFLISGAIFDIVQVYNLNEKISKSPKNLRDQHQLALWLTAVSFFLFTALAGMYTHLDSMITTVFLSIYIYLFIMTINSKFKNFLTVQMTYCVVVAVNMIVLSLHV